MKQNLKGVPETLLIPLWARAVESENSDPIVKDNKAVEMMEQIDYDFSKFEKEWATQISIAIRTEILDNATLAFMNKHNDGVIINIGCGLDTRFSRLDNDKIRWYDLDLPESIHLRKQFFRESDHYKMIAKSVYDYSWIDDITNKKHVLIIAEGLFMYFTEKEVNELLDKLVNNFPQAEMLIETIPLSLVKQSQTQDIIKKQYQMDLQFHWGIKNGKDIEKLNNRIEFIEDWHYFDYHRDRWKIIRWISVIPVFKSRFGNRIIHLKLG